MLSTQTLLEALFHSRCYATMKHCDI